MKAITLSPLEAAQLHLAASLVVSVLEDTDQLEEHKKLVEVVERLEDRMTDLGMVLDEAGWQMPKPGSPRRRA